MEEPVNYQVLWILFNKIVSKHEHSNCRLCVCMLNVGYIESRGDPEAQDSIYRIHISSFPANMISILRHQAHMRREYRRHIQQACLGIASR